MIDENKQNRLDRFFKSGLSHSNFERNIPKDDVDFESIWKWMIKEKMGASSASKEFKVGKVRIEHFIKNTEKDITQTHITRVVDGVSMCHCRNCKKEKVLNEDNFQKFLDKRDNKTKFKTNECKDCRRKRQRESKTWVNRRNK